MNGKNAVLRLRIALAKTEPSDFRRPFLINQSSIINHQSITSFERVSTSLYFCHRIKNDIAVMQDNALLNPTTCDWVNAEKKNTVMEFLFDVAFITIGY